MRKEWKLARFSAMVMAGTLMGCGGNAVTSRTSNGQSVPRVFKVNGDTGRYNSEQAENLHIQRTKDDRREAHEVPASFDFYLLTLSWSPEFCITHPQALECHAHPGFVLHGLWPQNLNGTYPQHCAQTAPVPDASVYRDIFPDQLLLQHEWQTHGTCSGLSADSYFSDARKAVQSVAVPRELSTVTTKTQSAPQEIIAEFQRANPGFAAGSFALSCGNNRLTAVEVCLSKDLQPVSCQGVRSCRANIVKVTPPGALADQ